MIKKLFSFLAKLIKIKFNLKIYICINKNWVPITHNEFKIYLKNKDDVNKLVFDKFAILPKDDKNLISNDNIIELNKIDKKDVSQHIKKIITTFDA